MKIRLDSYLAEKELSASVERARREIMAGWVKINGETVRDPSFKITAEEIIKVERPGGRYVSRGGDKLEKALNHFSIDVRGRTAADLGASTGGFTDCLLQHGADYVYSIDVGYGQLDYSLRSDPRVRVLDRCNARSLDRSSFDRKIDFVTADLSFISILKVAEKISELFGGSEGVILIKPQFEAMPDELTKGVVLGKDLHKKILNRILPGLNFCGLHTAGLTFSPLKGPAGNIEFLSHFELIKPEESPGLYDKLIEDTVEEAHAFLN